MNLLGRSFSLNTSKVQSELRQDIDIDETTFSVFRGEEFSINKILSRDSSFGQSSRIYYTSTNNLGVPFQWERKPGTPMNPPREEAILQPTPPPPSPAMQSLVLPRPKVERKSSSLSWRFWLWRKRLRRIMRLQMYDRRRYLTGFSSKAKGNKVSSSDGELDHEAEFVGWIHYDSKSSSSSTMSSSVGLSSEHFESFREGIPFCCTTWRKHKSINK